MSEQDQGWIGVDLDGTLAHYDTWHGWEHIGEPIPLMVERVKSWLEQGYEVRIMTARASPVSMCNRPVAEAVTVIGDWCEKHIGTRLPVTCSKDMNMLYLWDDRAVAVETNTGKVLSLGMPQ